MTNQDKSRTIVEPDSRGSLSIEVPGFTRTNSIFPSGYTLVQMLAGYSDAAILFEMRGTDEAAGVIVLQSID